MWGGTGAEGEDGAGLRGKHSALRKVTTRGQRTEVRAAWGMEGAAARASLWGVDSPLISFCAMATLSGEK